MHLNFFSTFTRAMDRAGRRIEDFRLSMLPSDSTMALQLYMSLGCPSLFQNLDSLSILSQHSLSFSLQSEPTFDRPATATWDTILGSCPSLTRLELTGDTLSPSYMNIQSGLHCFRSSCLSTLKLESLTTTYEALQTLLVAHCMTLDCLIMADVTLENQSGSTDLLAKIKKPLVLRTFTFV